MTIRLVSAEDSYLVREGTRLLLATQDGIDLVASAKDLPGLMAMPNAELEMLPGAGHLPWLDDPDHAAKVVMEHITG